MDEGHCIDNVTTVICQMVQKRGHSHAQTLTDSLLPGHCVYFIVIHEQCECNAGLLLSHPDGGKTV